MRTIGLGYKMLVVLIACGTYGHASANIVASERAVLQKIYAATNGSQWSNTTANDHPWFAADADECNWHGVGCIGEHVFQLQFEGNNLVGQLPTDLDLGQLPELQYLFLDQNQLSGRMPALAGLVKLTNFSATQNQFSGPIPSLTGLTSLQYFSVISNRLSGLPPLTGLNALQTFYAYDNALTGNIPSLAGLTNLSTFDVSVNQLTGTIPSLAGLTNLSDFNVSSNRLTGEIPSLGGLTNLTDFELGNNRLTGLLPRLSESPSLKYFVASHNQLSGIIPDLDGAANLIFFGVGYNALTGSLPKTGPKMLSAVVCPNPLTLAPGPNDSAWNAVVDSTPWWSAFNSRCDILFRNDFEQRG